MVIRRKKAGESIAVEEVRSDAVASEEMEISDQAALSVSEKEKLALAIREEPQAISPEVITHEFLTPEERERLSLLEREVEQGFQIAGRALREIHERKLYREEFGTFEAYCESRFGLKRRHPYHLMTASIVADNLRARNVHIMPTGEYQIRPLTQVKEPETQVEIWKHALEKSGGRLPTYSQVLEAMRDVVGSSSAQGENIRAFSPGDVCVVKRTVNNLLSGKKGFWGIVDEVQGDTVSISLYDRTVCGVRVVDIEKLSFDKGQKERWSKILQSLKDIYNALGTSEEAVVTLLHHFGRKCTTFTPFERRLLIYIERQAKKSDDEDTSANKSSSPSS